jgi:predicted ATPase
LAYAEYFATALSQYRRDVEVTHSLAETLMALVHEQGFGLHGEEGRIFRGWALAMRGDTAEGITQLRQGLAIHQEIGPKLGQPHRLSLLAEAYGQARQPETGLQVLAEALTLVAATKERCREAELHRLKGALLLQLPTPDVHQAEACLQQALAVARDQQAKSLELRAALSLSRLWACQGRRDEARQPLAEVYGWFTEGFDTPDLQAARALLAELG